MAKFRIKANHNSSRNVSGATAFQESGPGTLIVDRGAYLISQNGGAGAVLGGNWTVKIAGKVQALDPSVAYDGIDLHAGSPADHSTVTIKASGRVSGSDTALYSEEAVTLTNAGRISGKMNGVAFGTPTGPIKIINSGLIQGVASMGILDHGSGVLTIINSGKIVGGNHAIQSDSETHITNTGTIDGQVFLPGAHDDTFNNFKKIGHTIKSGKVIGDPINLGDGIDHFNGGANAERVTDGGGSDIYKFGGGNDTYFAINVGLAADGTDTVNGGAGVDTYNATGAPSLVLINLDRVEHTDLSTIAANTAQGIQVSGGFVQKDTVTNFENANGGNNDDSIFGNAQKNVLHGNGGNDGLFGLGGNDRLFGDFGTDRLIGGKGADLLSGGGSDTNADSFVFNSLKDSTVAKSGRDTITDFEQGHDKINLATIDAIKGGSDDQFDFIGTAHFNGTAGQLRESYSHGNTIVSGDVNGDGKADFSILLKGHFLLNAIGDFNL